MSALEAQAIVMNFIGGQYEERWPEEERNAIFSTAEFSYDQRMEVGTFLFGNLRDINLVFAAVRPQFGADPTHVDHFKRFLADLASGHVRPEVRPEVPLLRRAQGGLVLPGRRAQRAPLAA